MKRYMLYIALMILQPCAAYAEEMDWTALNPELADATYIGSSEKCLECHEDYMATYKHTVHAKAAFKMKQNDCEECHGPMSKHLDAPKRRPPLTVSFKKEWGLTPEQKNSICLQCHEKGLRMHWKGSPHEMSGVSCSNCHYVMEKRSANNLFINEDPKKGCFACHSERRAQLQRSSHMPLREGKMDCASCHNPHGGPGPILLKTASVNETCYPCHAEKRGPLLWEHPPVRENCSTCHDPHGSNIENLLKIKVPYLCQSCHLVEFHPSTMYDGSKLPSADQSNARRLFGKSCLNCHSQIHGSNHPSGKMFQR